MKTVKYLDTEIKTMLLRAFKKGFFDVKDVDMLVEKGVVGIYLNTVPKKIILHKKDGATFVIDEWNDKQV